MKETIEKIGQIGNNKFLKGLIKTIYIMLYAIVAAILIVVVVQRVSNNTISIGGFRLFNIVSESMVPKYNIGDVLLSKSVEYSDIKLGDDLVYLGNQDSFTGKIITHQVIGIEENEGTYRFHTQGIANTAEDPVVSESQVYGIVVHKMWTLSLLSKIVNNIYLFYFLIFLPIALILFLDIRREATELINDNKPKKKIRRPSKDIKIGKKDKNSKKKK